MTPPHARAGRSVSVFLLGAAVALAGVAVWSWLAQPSSGETMTVAAVSDGAAHRPASSAQVVAAAALHDGMYLVGADLQPGVYVTRSILPACYFAVTTDLSGSLASVVTTYFGDAFGRRVELETGQYFETDECGIWTQDTPLGTGAVP